MTALLIAVGMLFLAVLAGALLDAPTEGRAIGEADDAGDSSASDCGSALAI